MASRNFLLSDPIFSSKSAREAAVFAAVVALLVDAMFFMALSGVELGGAPLAVWSGLKVAVVAFAVGWLAVQYQAWALGLVAAIFALIGLEDAIGITAPLGIWLVEESGIRRGPQGTNSQLLRRGFVMLGLLGPSVYLAVRSPQQLRRTIWILLGFLAAVFVAAVLGDVAADRTGTNVEELIEEPIVSLTVGFSVGLLVEWWRTSRDPTRKPLLPRSPRS